MRQHTTNNTGVMNATFAMIKIKTHELSVCPARKVRQVLPVHGDKPVLKGQEVHRVRNPAGNAAALTITHLAGGTRPVSAHLLITQIA